MSGNKLESRRRKDSYEIIRNGELIFYFRKDAVPPWFIRTVYAVSGGLITMFSYLKFFAG